MSHLEAKRFEIIHEAFNFFKIRSREGIADYGQCCGAPQWCCDDRSAFVKNFFDGEESFPNLDFSHEPDSFRERNHLRATRRTGQRRVVFQRANAASIIGYVMWYLMT